MSRGYGRERRSRIDEMMGEKLGGFASSFWFVTVAVVNDRRVKVDGDGFGLEATRVTSSQP